MLDRSAYPRLKVCGSGLSPNALAVMEKLGVKDRFEPQHLHMRGVTAIGPGGQQIDLRGEHGAWVVPRTELDHGMLMHAQDLGAAVMQGTRVAGLLRDPSGRVRGVRAGDGTELEADLVVCANGSPSQFEPDSTPRYGIRTIMGWWKGVRLRVPDQGVMIWDARLDGYYAWAFPEPHDVVNIGLTIADNSPRSKGLRGLFSALLDEHFGLALEHADQVGRWKGHPATVTTRISETICQPFSIWTGEAARLVSPATVEGIGFAMESGAVTARLIAKHFVAGRGFAPRHARLYRAQLAVRMLPKFWAGEGFVHLMRSPRALGVLARVFNPQKLAQLGAVVVGERN